MTTVYTLQPGEQTWEKQETKGLADFQRLVGGYIESVPIGEDLTLYCNEEGKLDGLPTSAVWMVRGKPYDLLCGPLVLVGPPDEDGNDTDATPGHLNLLRKHLKW